MRNPVAKAILSIEKVSYFAAPLQFRASISYQLEKPLYDSQEVLEIQKVTMYDGEIIYKAIMERHTGTNSFLAVMNFIEHDDGEHEEWEESIWIDDFLKIATLSKFVSDLLKESNQ